MSLLLEDQLGHRAHLLDQWLFVGGCLLWWPWVTGPAWPVLMYAYFFEGSHDVFPAQQWAGPTMSLLLEDQLGHRAHLLEQWLFVVALVNRASMASVDVGLFLRGIAWRVSSPHHVVATCLRGITQCISSTYSMDDTMLFQLVFDRSRNVVQPIFDGSHNVVAAHLWGSQNVLPALIWGIPQSGSSLHVLPSWDHIWSSQSP